ncbi:MAG TPA: hypothetical protein VK810_03145 [Dongiaceae bacterium]|jgi:hypothetical protein|nr:hypothetical protein [Dongiaceae bacterium]
MKFLLSIIFVLVLFAGCSQKMPTVMSPDSSMSLVTSVEQSQQDPQTYLCVVFEIRDQAGKILHRENTHASVRMRWNMSWESNNRIRLDSSNIGTHHWTKQLDGNWKKD